MPNADTTPFGLLDWAIFAAYLGVLLAIGAWASRKGQGTSDYFLGGRRMPVWAVALSVLATATSAATFIGGPEEAYVGDLTYLSTNIGTILAVVVVALLFIPAFYRHNVTTVYDLLEHRYGPGARSAASWTFMIGRVFASGARIFVAALPASLVLFGDTEPSHMALAIGAITAVGILTALGGGIRSVIFTDVLQVFVFVLAAAAALYVLIDRIPLSIPQIFTALRDTPVGDHSKLAVVTVGLDPSQPGLGFDPSRAYTLLTALFGFSLLNLAAFGTDHDLTQRMLTCKNAVRGGSSAFLALALNLPMVAMFMAVGLLLHIFYQRPDLMAGATPPATIPSESKNVFLRFILDEMPPGLTGLMMAGLFAVGVGSLNSALGAMSAAFVNDVYRPALPGRDDEHYLRIGQVAVFGWGVTLGLFACACMYWHDSEAGTLIQFVLGVMTFAYAGLLGVFLTALLTRRGSTRSVVAAIVAGFVAVTLMQPGVWADWTGATAWTRATPLDPTDWRLGDLKLAFPWRLTIAVAISFAVCCLGRPRDASRRVGGD